MQCGHDIGTDCSATCIVLRWFIRYMMRDIDSLSSPNGEVVSHSDIPAARVESLDRLLPSHF